MMKQLLPNQTTILKFWFIIFIFSSVLANPLLCAENSSNSAHTNTNKHTQIATCLAENGVKNFTLFPQNLQDTKAYYHFLDLSIQNLRFTRPSVPKPVAIVMPESKDQLVKTVLCCSKESLEIRARSGGHSYEGISSVATDGLPFVIIDLMNLDKVSVDLELQMAWVEGGATIGQVYYAISRASTVHGFPAGSCPTIGVGGHFSGGGFGLLARKHGLAADNVVDAVLLDANGRVLDRESMGEEVFWAIRGGGGGIWGIVYSWKIRLVRVPEIVTGCGISRPGAKGNVSRLVKKWQDVAPKLSGDFYLSVSLRAGSPGVVASFTGFYLGRKKEFMSTLNKVFPELDIAPGECKEMSWIESVFFFSGLNPPKGRSVKNSISELGDRYMAGKSFFKAKSDYVKTPISITGIRTALEQLEKEPKGYVIFDPYGGFMDNVSSDFIAFPHRKGNLFSIQYQVVWDENDDEEDRGKGYIKWIRGFFESMAPYVSQHPREAYVNYIDLDLGVFDDGTKLLVPNYSTASGASANNDQVARARVWGEKYFLRNYDRLVRAKTFVDPLNVYRNQQGIPPMSRVVPNAKP